MKETKGLTSVSQPLGGREGKKGKKINTPKHDLETLDYLCSSRARS